MMKFAPLNIVSGYSFLRSALTIEKITGAVKKNDYFGAGLADFGVLYGAPSFSKALKSINRPLLIGLTIELDDQYVVYANSEIGYRNIIAISKEISLEKLNIDFLLNHLSGTILVLETNYGKFKSDFDKEFNQDYLTSLAKLSSKCDDFYLGLEVTTKSEFKVAQNIREFAKERGYKTIAFPKIKYQAKEDAMVLLMLEAIDKEEKIEIDNVEGPNFFNTNEYYSKIYTKSEIENTNLVLTNSKFDFDIKRGEMLHYPVENSEETLKFLVFEGLKKNSLEDEEHIKRANYELDVICSMGYADYFLIVADYVNYAKTHKILVGPGRGSAAGSLVSYALGITEVDPLEYNLVFERFLNKARKTMPDIDVDFMDTSRDEMVDYMREKYGEERVANIVAFQTIQAKQALRDVGRILSIPTHHIDMLSKSITDKVNLKEAYKKIPAFRKLVDSDKYFLNIVSNANKILDLPRQAGTHAAGIIVNNSAIDSVLPVTVNINGNIQSQFEKDYLEEQGFLKMDFLALRNLTTIDICSKLIKQNHNVDLDFYHIPYKDENALGLINKGYTAGLFQLESLGMKNAIKILGINEFINLVELISLHRPGPQDHIKDYALRKSGKIKVHYLDDKVKDILGSTYGILVYQEQINQLAVAMAGFTPEKADLFRRAVSKKKKEEILAAKEDFIKGSLKNGYSLKDTTTIFEDIIKFANYGFNKSHAVVYAITGSRMAYLKYYYPLEFYTALLMTSSGAGDSKFSEYMSELNKRNLKILPPDINSSKSYFIVKDNSLLFPLSFIKGISVMTSNIIIDERNQNGPYLDFFDFVKRAYAIKLGEATVLKLINAGCFDSMISSRATLRATLKYAMQYAELAYGEDGQIVLDATFDTNKQYFQTEDDPLENLAFENEVLGIMLSDNPLKYHKEKLDSLGVINIEEAKERWGNCSIAGIITNIKTIKTKKDKTPMAFIKIADEVSEIEVTIFPELFANNINNIVKNNIIIIKGRYDSSNDRESFTANEISLLEE
ncbi:MAG: DNA polymerase III subunit alpha [Bacilli bacterium]|nr:DNA polymerase III subunit alpha [Bacilli bacterium]